MYRLEKVESLFHQALGLPPRTNLPEWIKARCEGDAELLQEVLSLVNAHSEMKKAPVTAPLEDAALPAAQFGAYRATQLLGRGGMSAVYLARRTDGQFDQTVALKIMASYLASPEFLARFQTERQLLASLSHNNIPRLLDGGVSSAGDPYLITEYVEGQTIDRYCDERKLGVDARLRIFLQVCEAVDYAHRNLIVHRDLKPANILVSLDGTVKLLDFGTASLLAGEGEITATRAWMLTPRYASPEQLRGEHVSVATDIFSLGVILYELVCGAWPFGDPNSVISELNRAAGHVAVTPPAEAVRAETARDRSLPADALTRLLQGELSTILLKLLESEPARRYGSARQVIEDLERYRQGRPILARPQTAWYAARKFVGRNWLLVSAAGLGVLALAGLTVFSLYQSVQAREQAARAQRISEFVKNTFVSGSSTWQSPLRGQSRAIQFQDVLDSAAERVGKELANDPLAEADLRGTIGSTYSVLGDPVKGEAQILQAIQLLKRTPDGSPRVAADLQARLCDARSYQGHFAEAWAACREALDLARRNPGSTLWLGGTIHDTAYMAVKSGAPFAEAEKLYREAAADLPKDESKRKLWPAIINTRIGFMRIEQGDLVEGDRLLRGAEQLLRAEPGPPIEIIPTLNARAFRERVRGNYNEAVKLLSEAVDLLTARPTSYMGVGGIELELAADEALAGNPRALSRLQRVQAGLTSTASAPVERVRLELLSGIVEARSGLAESAARRFRSALAISEKEVPRQPAERAELCLRLAQVLAASGRAQEAVQVARQGLENAEAAYGAFFSQHPFVIELRKAAR